jgi:hypothetical protein
VEVGKLMMSEVHLLAVMEASALACCGGSQGTCFL